MKVTPTKFDKVFIIQLLELSVETAFRIIADGNGERLSPGFEYVSDYLKYLQNNLNFPESMFKTENSLSFRYEKPSSLFSRRYWSTSNGLWSHYKRNHVVSFTISLKLRWSSKSCIFHELTFSMVTKVFENLQSDAPDLDEIKLILNDLKYLMEAHFCSENYQRIEFIFVDNADELLFVTTSVAVNIKDYDDGDNSVDLSHFEDLHQILRNMVNISYSNPFQYVTIEEIRRWDMK